jgi:hypothetical protein
MKLKQSGLPAFVCLISLALFLIFYTPFLITASAAEYDQSLSPGDLITFGHYEQDNDMNNGKEAIQWRVLAREGDKALVISVDILDHKAYNTEDTSVTWESCTLRGWLNGSFLNTAFTRVEQEDILTMAVKNEDNSEYGTDGGLDTSDMVFLLSITEVELLFWSNEDRMAKNTAYTKAQGAWSSHEETGWWWLRSPGNWASAAACVAADGSVNQGGGSVSSGVCAVRPALWLDLTYDIITSEEP